MGKVSFDLAIIWKSMRSKRHGLNSKEIEWLLRNVYPWKPNYRFWLLVELMETSPRGIPSKTFTVITYLICLSCLRDYPKKYKLTKEVALAISETLQIMGVLAVEFFLAKDGRLVVNELAPVPTTQTSHY